MALWHYYYQYRKSTNAVHFMLFFFFFFFFFFLVDLSQVALTLKKGENSAFLSMYLISLTGNHNWFIFTNSVEL